MGEGCMSGASENSPSLSSPVAAVADPLESVVDREIIRLDANRFPTD